MEPGSRPALHSRLPPLRSSLLGTAGLRNGARSCGRAATPAPPPLLVSHAPRRRHAPPHIPRAPPLSLHTSITARLHRSPAPAGQSGASLGGLKPPLPPPPPAQVQNGGRRFPDQRRRREASAAAQRAAGGGGRGAEDGEGAGRTRGELGPSSCSREGRERPPRRRGERGPVPRAAGPSGKRETAESRGGREGWWPGTELALVGSLASCQAKAQETAQEELEEGNGGRRFPCNKCAKRK
ncbi:uncharacterized protein LOC144250331 [Urocitellus parryii]